MVKFFERIPEYPTTTRVIAALADGPSDAYGSVPYAEMSYHPGRIRPNFDVDESGKQVISRDFHRHAGELPEYWNEWNEQPQTLFHVERPHVEGLFADASMRPHAMTLLGHVLSHAQMLGVPVEAAESLSAHSSNLVKQGIAAGLVVGDRFNPEGNVTNMIGRTPAHEYSYKTDPLYYSPDSPYDKFTEIPESKVSEMRKVSRESIKKVRGKKRKKTETPKPPPQGEQLSFDI